LFTFAAVKWKPLKFLPVLISGTIIAGVCLLQALSHLLPGFGFFQRLEWMSYDWRVRVANQWSPPVTDQLGFVYIGDDAIALFSEGKLGNDLRF
jgi:hypothetical protein